MTRRGPSDDSGAVLVLAVLFVLVVGLVGGALVGFAGNSLAQTSTFNADRSQSYAAESAVQVAIQQIRSLQSINTAPGYAPPGSSTLNPCPTTSVSIPENTVNGSGGVTESFNVMCAIGRAPLPYERDIVFAACLSGTSPANCLTDATTGTDAYVPKPQYPGAVVVATTTFSDLQNGCHVTNFNDNCFAPGSSVDVNDWNVAKSNA
jgi:hypothetical protein